jgi:hypothetical protein
MTATAAERALLVRRWERASEWPLMIAAVVFLAAYAVPIIEPGSSALAARLVSFAELDQLGDLRCRHRRPVVPGRQASPLSGPALV